MIRTSRLSRADRPSCALAVALLAAMLLAGPGAAAARSLQQSAPVAVIKEIEGKLVHRDAHVKQIWKVATDSGDVYSLPMQPQDKMLEEGQLVPAGAVISLTCTLDPEDELNCTSISAATVTRFSAPVKTTGLTLKLLVMVLSLSGSCSKSGAQISDVQQAFNSASGYANFMRNCSYGKVVFDKGAVTVVSTPVACSTAINNRCNEDAMATAARNYVTSQYGSAYLSGFTHFTYVLPNGLLNTCGWVGLAELPGTQTWYTPDEYGVYSKGTVMQEIVHNLNIYHGWKNGVEYDDNSTSMGMGNSCPSAPELWRLGWASVLDQLNTSTFTAKAFLTYTLPATYLGPDKAMIKIQPDWLGTSYTKNVYLGLRVKAGGDMDLLEEFNKKINIHEVAKGIDNNFLATGDPKITIIGTLAAGGTRDLTAYKLLIKAEALVEGGTKMVVKVCRYTASSAECKDSGVASPPPLQKQSPPPKQPPPQKQPPPLRSPPPPRRPPPVKQSPPPRVTAQPPPKRSPPPIRPPPKRSPPPKRPPPPKRSPPPMIRRRPPPPSPDYDYDYV